MVRKISLLIFIFSLSIQLLKAQTDFLKVPITYSATQKKISNILKDLETLAQCNFTYNSALFNVEEKVTITINNKSLKSVLDILFLNAFEYKQIGKQVLISPKKGVTIPTNRPKNNSVSNKAPPKESNKTARTIYDTIPVYDTITHIIHDTLITVINDTVIVMDSSMVLSNKDVAQIKEKTSLTFSLLAGSHISHPIFYNSNPEYLHNKLNNVEAITIGNNYGILLNYNKKKFTYGTGLTYYCFQQNSSYTTSYHVDDLTQTYQDSLWYWDYNLLFEYYKFQPGGDSVLIPVYDSTYTYKIVENPKKVEKRSVNSSINSPPEICSAYLCVV